MHRRRPLMWCLVCSSWLVLGMIALGHATARADATPAPTTASSTSAYDRFIEEALQAYDAGRFAEARSTFRRAHELQPTARTLRTIGMCSFNLGDYADAAWNLERARTETRKPLTDEQQKHASDLIAKANQHIGRFRLRLEPQTATLVVDGQSPLLLDQTELLLEAGHHDIEARASGYQAAHTALNVEGGDRTTLVLSLSRDAAASAVARVGSNPSTPMTASAVNTSAQPSTGSRTSLQSTLGYVTLGVGVAGLIGFGITSGLALSDKSTLDDHCPNTTCNASYEGTVSRYNALRTASTATLIGGSALVVLGGLLLLTRPSERADRATLTPLLGPGSVGVRGRL
jgi:hypothetical protein